MSQSRLRRTARSNGPLDDSEANAVRPYVDLGGVKIVPRADLQLRLEVEEGTQRVVAVAMDYAGSTLQVQPFAAPRTSGLWAEIRDQIVDQIQKQGGTTRIAPGPFGPEVLAQIPGDGRRRDRVAPGAVRRGRWAALVSARRDLGRGAVDPEAASHVEDLFRSVVVVRGNTPMPPRDLIPLHMPANAGGCG